MTQLWILGDMSRSNQSVDLS
ncbi:MAG: hypothetical protein JWP97_6881, partial [Labilithrix sp.]|nr:hypothetical protein [Labilithrix sp.]